MEILFGGKVICQGGEGAGEVARVIVESQTHEVTDLIIANSPLTGIEVVVPLSLVQGPTGQGLMLYATVDQFRQLPQYLPTSARFLREEEVGGASPQNARLPKGAEGEPPHAMEVRRVQVPLGAGCEVFALDGRVGPLTGVRLDLYTNKLSSVIVGGGALFEKTEDVPAQWIAAIEATRITLAQTADQARLVIGPEAGPYLAVEADETDIGGEE